MVAWWLAKVTGICSAQCGFSPGTPASSHSPWMSRELVILNYSWECVCLHVVLQWSDNLSRAYPCLLAKQSWDNLQQVPEILHRKKQVQIMYGRTPLHSLLKQLCNYSQTLLSTWSSNSSEISEDCKFAVISLGQGATIV